MKTQPSVSLVIPMFNEELNIEHALACAIEALGRYSSDWEIVVVDDASTDRSAEIVAREIAAEPRIRMVRHPVNRKLGASLKTGFAAVTKDLAGQVHAGKIVGEIAPIVGGKGGGRPELAQAGGTDASQIDAALARAVELVS